MQYNHKAHHLDNKQGNQLKYDKSIFKRMIETIVYLLTKINPECYPETLNKCDMIPEYQEFIELLTQLKLADIGLNHEDLKNYFEKDTIVCANLIETDLISLGFFCIPAGMVLDLHDHPNMLVTSKVFYGEVLRRSMDLVDRRIQFFIPKYQFNKGEKPLILLDAVLDSEDIFCEGSVFNLTPIKGNIHSFVALKDTIIFDILTPYYDHKNRFCNYYKEIPIHSIFKKPEDPSNLQQVNVKNLTEKQNGQAMTTSKRGQNIALIYLFDPPSINVKIVPFPQVPTM